MATFNLDGARAAGYTDQQIADKLGSDNKFDVAGARAAGYRDADIISKLTASARVPVPTATRPPEEPEIEDPGIGQTMLIGAGRTFDRVGKGMQQVFNSVTGNKQANAELATRAADDDTQYKKLQTLRPFATGIGEALPSMAIPIGATATAAGTAAKLAAASAIPAALEYGTVGERAQKAATSAAGAVVGGLVIPKAAGAIFQAGKNGLRGLAGNITPEAIQLAAQADKLGIKVNAAQLGDSKFLKVLKSTIDQVPFTGGSATTAAQRSEFTRAVSKTFGDNVEKITPEIYSANRTRLGKGFEDVSMRNTLKVDEPLMNRLQFIVEETRQMGDDSTVKAVESAVNRIIKQTNAGTNEVPNVAMAGVPRHVAEFELPGAAYQSFDTSLGKIIKNGGEKAVYLKEVQNAVRNAMDESISPADQMAWRKLRTQYKNLKAVRDIVAKGQGEGDIPPSQLVNALTNSEAGKEAMAMGNRGTLGELGRIGKQFVQDNVPNSGTAQRALAMGLLGGGGYAMGVSPETIALTLGGGATLGKMMNKAMVSPKVIELLKTKGMTVKDLLALPPDRINQILGGAAGMATANQPAQE